MTIDEAQHFQWQSMGHRHPQVAQQLRRKEIHRAFYSHYSNSCCPKAWSYWKGHSFFCRLHFYYQNSTRQYQNRMITKLFSSIVALHIRFQRTIFVIDILPMSKFTTGGTWVPFQCSTWGTTKLLQSNMNWFIAPALLAVSGTFEVVADDFSHCFTTEAICMYITAFR